jgi:hypothetical protein
MDTGERDPVPIAIVALSRAGQIRGHFRASSRAFRPASRKLLTLICPAARQKNLSRGLEIVKRVLIDDADDLKAKLRNLGSLCLVYRTASVPPMPFEPV